MTEQEALATLRRLRTYPTFDYEMDGVPYTVEYDYYPAEPHCSADMEVRKAMVGGHDVLDHLSKPAKDGLEHAAWMHVEQMKRAGHAASVN